MLKKQSVKERLRHKLDEKKAANNQPHTISTPGDFETQYGFIQQIKEKGELSNNEKLDAYNACINFGCSSLAYYFQSMSILYLTLAVESYAMSLAIVNSMDLELKKNAELKRSALINLSTAVIESDLSTNQLSKKELQIIINNCQNVSDSETAITEISTILLNAIMAYCHARLAHRDEALYCFNIYYRQISKIPAVNSTFQRYTFLLSQLTFYLLGQQSNSTGKFEEACEHYQKAIMLFKCYKNKFTDIPYRNHLINFLSNELLNISQAHINAAQLSKILEVLKITKNAIEETLRTGAIIVIPMAINAQYKIKLTQSLYKDMELLLSAITKSINKVSLEDIISAFQSIFDKQKTKTDLNALVRITNLSSLIPQANELTSKVYEAIIALCRTDNESFHDFYTEKNKELKTILDLQRQIKKDRQELALTRHKKPSSPPKTKAKKPYNRPDVKDVDHTEITEADSQIQLTEQTSSPEEEKFTMSRLYKQSKQLIEAGNQVEALEILEKIELLLNELFNQQDIEQDALKYIQKLTQAAGMLLSNHRYQLTLVVTPKLIELAEKCHQLFPNAKYKIFIIECHNLLGAAKYKLADNLPSVASSGVTPAQIEEKMQLLEAAISHYDQVTQLAQTLDASSRNKLDLVQYTADESRKKAKQLSEKASQQGLARAAEHEHWENTYPHQRTGKGPTLKALAGNKCVECKSKFQILQRNAEQLKIDNTASTTKILNGLGAKPTKRTANQEEGADPDQDDLQALNLTAQRVTTIPYNSNNVASTLSTSPHRTP